MPHQQVVGTRTTLPTMRRILMLLVGLLVFHVGTVAAAAPESMVTDRAQYLPGEVVTFTLGNWCNASDVPFIAVFDATDTMVVQITDATESGGTVTAAFAAPATLGVYTARSQAQSCPERVVTFEVVASITTTTTIAVPTTADPALPDAGASHDVMLVLVLAVVGGGLALVGISRRGSARAEG